MIRLIALDLDQTVFGSDLVVSPVVQSAIARAQRAGVVVTIATGREARLSAQFARELNVQAPMICSQGGCIYDHVQEKVLHDVRLAPEVLPRIIDAAQRFGWNIHLGTFDRLYLPRESNHPPFVFDLIRHSNWVRVDDLLADVPEVPNKVNLTLNKPEDRDRVLEEVRLSLGPGLSCTPSHPSIVEILPTGVHKGHGLAWLAHHLAIDQPQVMAVGDSEADITMLEWAGVGVAMGNASPAVKAAANWVAPSLAEDGAAVAIEKFTLAQDCRDRLASSQV